ncbi:MAG: methyltransferase domain-containing protein, partial [Thermoanaerobaculia bacterium]
HVLVRDFFQKRIPPDATVVDMGAGPCLFINEVKAKRRIAVDANPRLPEFAGPGVETIITSDLTLSTLPDGSVTHFFISNFFEHLPGYQDLFALLGVFHRKLATGGELLILQPNYRLEPRRYFDFIDHTLMISDASLREVLEAANFKVVESRVRFLPFTSKSRVPKWGWLVATYLRLPPAQWILGKQTFMRAAKVTVGAR